MKRFFVTGLLTTITSFLFAQDIDALINVKETERIEKTLAADNMRGRQAFTPDIDRAADFITSEFAAAGLQTFGKLENYKQEFTLVKAQFISVEGNINGNPADPKNLIVVTSQPDLKVDQSSGYEIVMIKPGGSLFRQAYSTIQSGRNQLVLVDTSYSSNFSRLINLKNYLFKSDKSCIFILYNGAINNFSIEARHKITEQKLTNVVGILPGKSKKEEYVIFSGHYDHLGVGKPVEGDSIYNGANDDAAGTTAVIMLAKYFKQMANNERTLVFAAFTAEEEGGFGSQYFSRQFNPEKVMAMFNIEMIGTESKWGKNSAYITGYERTDMGKILQKELEGTGFSFYPDPYTKENLFFRSDNATLARLGVPAHTISTSKMDNEPNYHRVSDQVETLDMNNMAMIIKSIAISAKSIISGKDAPTRVNVDELK